MMKEQKSRLYTQKHREKIGVCVVKKKKQVKLLGYYYFLLKQ